MKEILIAEGKNKFIDRLYLLLLIILTIKITGFFSWSESVSVTRALKLGSRLLMTGAILYTCNLIKSKGYETATRLENSIIYVFYALYLFLGLISIAWSGDPGYSAIQWLMDTEGLLFAWIFIKIIVTVNHYHPHSKINIASLLGNAAIIIMCIFITGKFLNPDIFYRMTHGGEEARLGGWMMNPNELGMLCVAGIGCLLYTIYTEKLSVSTIIKCILLFYALVLTGSRSSLIGLILIIFLYISYSKNKKLRSVTLLLTIAAIPFAVKNVFIKEGGIDEVLSMTGRLPFWKALLSEGLPKEPLFGFGFMRIDYDDTFQSVHTYAAQMTHNTFIQVVMNLGFTGLFLVIIQVFLTVKLLIYNTDKIQRLLLLSIFIPIIINSFTEFGIFGENNYGILFYQFILFSLIIHHREKQNISLSGNRSTGISVAASG